MSITLLGIATVTVQLRPLEGAGEAAVPDWESSVLGSPLSLRFYRRCQISSGVQIQVR